MTLNYGYNATGDRTSMADSLGSAGLTTYLYDSAHRLTTITRSLGGTAGPQVAYTYDNNSRVTKVARTIGGSGTQVDSNFSYDNAGNVGTITFKSSGSSFAWATYAYGYDSANRLTSETNPEGTVAYSYDNADQLTGVTGARTESYSYDSGGNRTMAGYSTTTGNRLSAGAGYTFTYDNEGNTTSKTLVATGAKTDYAWDYRNRLTGVIERNSGGTVIMQATYTYDPLGRRIGVNVDDDGAGPHAAVQSWTVYDGDNTYADFDGSGTLATRYLYGPAIDALLARTSSGGTTAWYMTDRLGSVRDVVDTSGTVLDHVSYDSYGNILTESSPGNGDRFKFAGREYDSITGLYGYRARYYDPEIGCFASPDPSGFDGGDANLFRSCFSSPPMSTNPIGKQAQVLQGPRHRKPTGRELILDPKVVKAMIQVLSLSKEGTDRVHEEGAWIFWERSSGRILIREVKNENKVKNGNGRSHIFFGRVPYIKGAELVGMIHSHPDPGKSYDPDPAGSKVDVKNQRDTYKVPWLVVTRDTGCFLLENGRSTNFPWGGGAPGGLENNPFLLPGGREGLRQ